VHAGRFSDDYDDGYHDCYHDGDDCRNSSLQLQPVPCGLDHPLLPLADREEVEIAPNGGTNDRLFSLLTLW
jgi:hypothetical protein